MKVKLTLISLLVISITITVFLFSRYFNPTYTHKKPNQAAFVISFDDQYIKEWYNHRDLFKKYNVKATFFITNAKSLTTEEVDMLRSLVSDGHEIGSHGAEHVNAIKFIEKNSLQKYIQKEAIASIKDLQKHGFSPVTFAYPYGANSRQSDYELFKYFYLLRGDSWKVDGKEISKLDKIFHKYDGARIVNGLGIDSISNITLAELETGFKRASTKKEAIILYAHSISLQPVGNAIQPQTLVSIFKLAKKYKLSSLTFKELVL